MRWQMKCVKCYAPGVFVFHDCAKIMNTVKMADKEKNRKASVNIDKQNRCNDKKQWNSNQSLHSPDMFTQNFQQFNGQNFVFPETQYKNMREYAQAVHCWLWQYRMLAAFSAFQSQMISAVAQNAALSQNTNASQANNNNGTTANGSGLTGGTPAAASHTTTGRQYKVPMLWRRVVAEFLDFVLLFYTKILVTVAVLRQMGYMNEDLLDIDTHFPFLSDIGDLDYDKVFSLTSELIALEVVNRLCITLVETMCLRQGYAGSVGGATPGKKIMQLRVVSFTEVRELRHGHILVVGAKDPGFFNALIRSIIKNFSMAFFFPACFTAFFFRYNRAAYDVLAQTIVVEVENRRPQQAH